MKRKSRPAEWRLEAFLYFLIRDHLPLGKIEEIREQIKIVEQNDLVPFPSGYIQSYAHELLEELKMKWIGDL